jgi:hypothetical protein
MKSNNVASIWLLRGNAGAVMVRNCDGAATTAFCSTAGRFFCPKAQATRHVLVDAAWDQAQSSLKSDRSPPPPAQAIIGFRRAAFSPAPIALIW